MFIIIVVLVILVIGLLIYNIKIYNKVQSFKNTNQKISNLNILQDFMDIAGGEGAVGEKIQKMNDKLIERYGLKYSSIVVFNGAEYVLKATNVAEKHWDILKNLHKEEIFKESISTATPKYITIDRDEERLPYQQSEFSRAKSAMFLPLYIDNVYIGYWIIESGEKHAFDSIDLNILIVIRDNIVSVLKTMQYQDTMENIVRKDLFTDLYSAEYLYSHGKKIIDKYTISTICMFKITNLEEINEIFNRKTGNNIVTEVSNVVKANIAAEYIFVRYMGPKFVIAFSGIEPDGVVKFLKDMQILLNDIRVPQNNDGKVKKQSKKEKIAIPKVNFVLSTYYKGTGLEGVTKKLEEYLDEADKNENDINFI